MFKSVKKHDFLIVAIILILTVLIGYYYVNRQARNELWLKSYPIRAELALTHVSCSENSPEWLKEILIYQTHYNNAPANQIAYIDEHNNLHHCESGYRGEYPILSKRISPTTRFRYASVSKLWTSDSILDLIKQKKIAFDDPLKHFISEIDKPIDDRIANITIRELLLHRGGFDRNDIKGQDMFGRGKPICPSNLERLNEIQLSFTPNEKMSYSNLGYCLLGEVISQKTHTPFIEFIDKKYRLRNSNLKYIGNHALPDEVSYNYVETGISGIGNIYTAFNYKGLAAAAGLSGSAIDLAKQIKKMVLKPLPNILSLDEELSCNLSRMRDCYGYAMFPYQVSEDKAIIYYRDGKLLGLSSLVAVTEDKRVIALLSNGNGKEDEQSYDRVKYFIYQKMNDTLN